MPTLFSIYEETHKKHTNQPRKSHFELSGLVIKEMSNHFTYYTLLISVQPEDLKHSFF